MADVISMTECKSKINDAEALAYRAGYEKGLIRQKDNTTFKRAFIIGSSVGVLLCVLVSVVFL